MTDRPEDKYPRECFADSHKGMNAYLEANEEATKYRALAKALEAGSVRIVPTVPTMRQRQIMNEHISGGEAGVGIIYRDAIKAAPEWEWGGK